MLSTRGLFRLSKYVPNANLLNHRVSLSTSSEPIFLTDKYNKFTLAQLNGMSRTLSQNLLKNLNCTDLKGERIAVLCSNNYTYMISLMAIWQANGVPLGLNKQYPSNLIEYFLNDSKCKLVINGIGPDELPHDTDRLSTLLDRQKVIDLKIVENEYFKMNDGLANGENSLEFFRGLLNKDLNKESLILYTSGTSGPPKGVVLTRGNMTTTVETLIDTWKWTPKDCLLHVLPLNHVHGLTYGLLTSAYAGASCDMLPKFNAELVWSKLVEENNEVNVFMAVPTIFVQLVDFYMKNESLREKYSIERIRKAFKTKIRLIASGSAPLNVKTYNEWNEITGYKILERYGMTEIGLGLTNVYTETVSRGRVAGCVGRPYGETWVRIVEANDDVPNMDSKHVLIESYKEEDKVFGEDKELIGELQVKGSMVFKEYHDKPVQTRETFTDDGWFKTGDTAIFLKDSKIYKLLGRTSVDVIKSGGYKISALDIEKELLAHPQIEDVAVMGISDPTWGQRIFSLIVLKPTCSEREFNRANYVKWCKERLPKASVPTLIKIIDIMPRNQLGKVNKKELIKKYETEKNFL